MKLSHIFNLTACAKGKGLSMPLLVFLMMLVPFSLNATPLKLSLNKLSLNAEYKAAEDKNAPFFVILHGTFAWHGMELPSSLQSLLQEEDIGSLAFTLSLKEDNRSGFFDCKHVILSKHQDAQVEIAAWVKLVEGKGYKNIVLVGHSRGGAQIAQFVIEHPESVKQAFLIAPMTWKASESEKAFDPKDTTALGRWLSQAQNASNNTKQLISGKNILHCDNATVSLESLVSYYSPIPDKNTPHIISKVQIPTRIYLGSNDPAITNSINQQEALYLDNKMVSRKVIEDADHYFRDFAAEDIVADMLQQLHLED
ncbi:MAG: alpha/beta fold hydrolase [Enterobacterales bacterium]|nr:alpha/beta fold hydrolase [Enterobacterales bacterium]